MKQRPLLAAAVRAYGRQVLGGEAETSAPASPEAVGRRILRLVFGARSGEALPGALSGLVASHESENALAEVTDRVGETLAADENMADAVAGVISASYQRRADSGDVGPLPAAPYSAGCGRNRKPVGGSQSR